MDTLADRYKTVSELTQNSYSGDVVPPSIKSQALSAQKFGVIYYYLVNMAFFVYSVFVPLVAPPPYFGGIDPHDFHGNGAHLTIICVVLAIVLVRFVVMSWTAEFYHFILLLAMFEISFMLFTAVFWSPGAPLLLMMFLSNLLNMSVSQAYWKSKFLAVIADLPSLVPPAAPHAQDNTDALFHFNDFGSLAADLVRLLGFKKFKSAAALYDERCGVFGTKDQMSHVKALHYAYMQAVEPRARWAPWSVENAGVLGEELPCADVFWMVRGALRTLVSNIVHCLAGLWLGTVLFVDWRLAPFAIPTAIVVVVAFFVSARRCFMWLEEALGVAVAEKEWLAFDVVKHSAQREEMTFDVLDVMGTSGAGTLKDKVMNPQYMQTGRNNMVFMWLCVANVADFIGEAYLARTYWSIALQTRYMMEALTPYDFRYFSHAKWEVTYQGTLIKAFQNLILVFMACLFTGNYYSPPTTAVPAGVVSLVGAAAFFQSLLLVGEAISFAISILGDKGSATHRHKFVSEWVVLVATIFAVTNVMIWLYLLPITRHWDLPVGRCKAEFNQALFAGACPAPTL